MPPTSSKSHRDVSAHALRAFTVGEGDGGTAATCLTRLEAHAAVRLDQLQGKTFDCYGLPLRRSNKSHGRRFSFIKSMKGLASYLTTSINPSFQECLVSVVESESDVRLEVRQITNGKGNRPRVLFAASLSTLVDVARDSVIEKDTVVFSQLPSSFQPADEGASSPSVSGVGAAPAGTRSPRSASASSPHHNPHRPHNTHNGGAASKKEELISTLFSAYGDIGLNLVFHAARAEEDKLAHHKRHASASSSHGGSGGGSGGSAARPYTRIGLRFVSTAERNEWLSFCGEAYMGLLLDSIRTNRDTVYVPDGNSERVTATSAAAAAAGGGGGGADVFSLEKPSEEAVESYIDFFLSARTKADGNNTNSANNGNANGGRGDSDPFVVPLGGALRIRAADGSLHAREVQLDMADEADDAGLPVTRSYLEFRRKLWSGKHKSRRIPLEGLQVYADDDQTGSSFFLEFVYGGKFAEEHASAASHSRRTSTAEQLFTLGAVQQSFLSGTDLDGAQDTVALECETGSFAARRQWLQWLEVALKKPVTYLSVARRKAEAQKPADQRTNNGLLGNRVVW